MENHLEEILKSALYRTECPDTMILVDYDMGLLDHEENQQIQQHLTICPHCQAELTRITTFAPSEVIQADPSWQDLVGAKWRKLKETGQLIIQVIDETLTLPSLTPAIAVKGDEPQNQNTLRQIVLTPEDTDDLDVEVLIELTPNIQNTCTLTVRVQDPEQWPDLAGTQVVAEAEDWQRSELTDDNGEAVLRELPQAYLGSLTISIQP